MPFINPNIFILKEWQTSANILSPNTGPPVGLIAKNISAEHPIPNDSLSQL